MKYVLKETIEHDERILCISILENNLVIGGSSRELSLYEMNNMIKKTLCSKSKSIRSVTQNRNTIACASYDGTGSIFKDKVFFDDIEGPDTEVKGIAMNDENTYLAISTRGKQVWILKMIDDFIEIDCILNEHTQDVKGVKFNEHRLFSFGYDCTIKMYENVNEEEKWVMIQNITEHQDTIWDVVFHKDLLISCDNNGNIYVFKLDQDGFYQFCKSERVSKYPIYSLKIIMDKYIAYVLNRFYIMIIDFDFKAILFIDNKQKSEINCFDWCERNNVIVSGNDDGKVYVGHIFLE